MNYTYNVPKIQPMLYSTRHCTRRVRPTKWTNTIVPIKCGKAFSNTIEMTMKWNYSISPARYCSTVVETGACYDFVKIKLRSKQVASDDFLSESPQNSKTPTLTKNQSDSANKIFLRKKIISDE